jgi:hypothetical protein
MCVLLCAGAHFIWQQQLGSAAVGCVCWQSTVGGVQSIPEHQGIGGTCDVAAVGDAGGLGKAFGRSLR